MLRNLRMTSLSTAAAAMMAIAALGTSTASVAQARNTPASQVNSTFPDSIKRAAIASSEGEHGSIAGTRIANTNYFVVYIKSQGWCGSGGCRAQIWTLAGGRPVRKESISVGYLPIVLLPGVDNGMPRIGVTTVAAGNRLAILPIAFDGQSYTNAMHDNLLTPNSGKPILTQAMLRPF
ncbi:hypothetical protein [Sphingosinicella sp. BN140058]|uniref:hypothetical protein n=1 Tax=Sphingosinicella sp. BN140058 TaxID=1892855 RepID=UPI001011C3CD|nr:hypothetical protein [Sphingosinicella sp. BN140058]QAY80306.1 hypothetical protein ETR14_27060 [Sphingosinicella sp. BN140058]